MTVLAPTIKFCIIALQVNQEAETETEPTEAQDETVSEENAPPSNEDILDELMVQLWNIVNEKNDILRRQTELEYLRRGHSLEVFNLNMYSLLELLLTCSWFCYFRKCRLNWNSNCGC